MPDRSRGLNGWPSTLYFTFESALSLLFWHRGHCFHPSGAGTETGPWASPAAEKASTATKTLMESMLCFRIWIPPGIHRAFYSETFAWGGDLTKGNSPQRRRETGIFSASLR